MREHLHVLHWSGPLTHPHQGRLGSWCTSGLQPLWAEGDSLYSSVLAISGVQRCLLLANLSSPEF